MAEDREKLKYCTFKTCKSSPLAKTFTNMFKLNLYESCKNIVTFEWPKNTASTCQVLTVWHKDHYYYHVFD